MQALVTLVNRGEYQLWMCHICLAFLIWNIYSVDRIETVYTQFMNPLPPTSCQIHYSTVNAYKSMWRDFTEWKTYSYLKSMSITSIISVSCFWIQRLTCSLSAAVAKVRQIDVRIRCVHNKQLSAFDMV